MKKVIIGLAVAVFFALAIVGFANQPQRVTKKIKNEEYHEIMERDLKYDYPETPTDVVKAFGRIQELIYSYKFEGKEEGRLEELIRQQLILFDDELIETNGGEDKIIISTMSSAKEFLDLKKKIIDVKYQTSGEQILSDDGDLYKFVNVIFYINAGGGEDVYRKYALRRDEDKRWKIFTYQDIEPFSIK
ncbi:MAG: hypothetical protein MJ245_01550 [Clostridia bacterium]|nr:hypothetical protein [Clostridia bacterium]